MKMTPALPLLVWGLVPSMALAQRDPPVWECYLSSFSIAPISIAPIENSKLALDVEFRKAYGPIEHREHQMYLIGYLQKDEAEILKIAADVALLDKRKQDKENLFLDVMIERGLATVIDTQVGERRATPVPHDRADDRSNPADQLNTFPFRFATANSELFGAISKLKHFGHYKVDASGWFESRFKFVLFVPVNDCKYATKVDKAVRGQPDFAHFDDRVGADGEKLGWSTPILYFKPLPYEFQFRRIEGDAIRVYVN